MEHKLWQTFEFEGKIIQVIEQENVCEGCFLVYPNCMDKKYDKVGRCCNRKDGKYVIFKEV